MSDQPEDSNAPVIREFRANQGRMQGNFAGAPLLLLHTKGAKSGQERIHPMMYLDLQGRRFVFASKAGADTNPDWYRNLVANPEVKVEMGEDWGDGAFGGRLRHGPLATLPGTAQ